MNFKSCIAAIGLCLLPFASQAGVIYEWRALNNETPRDITLQLEFERSAIDSGTFSFVINQDYGSEDPLPASGLLGLRYAFPGAYEAMDYSWNKGFNHGYGTLELELSFEKGGFLSGYIYANNAEHHILLASQGRRFTVLDANSDQGMESAGCEFGVECIGANGYIRRTDIPEPGSLALLGIGLLAAGRLRRKAAR